MIGFLRFVGIANAAVWFGSVIFFTLAVGPAFFSDSMLSLLGRPHAGAAVQIILERYFLLHQICGGIALVHLLAEWIYMRRPLKRLTLILLCGLLILGFVGGYRIQPKLQALHRTMYAPGSGTQQREEALKSFATLHGVSQILNFVVMCGVLIYLWRVTTPTSSYRFRA
jgi:hypothetical protein